jgi:hypothetical protein
MTLEEQYRLKALCLRAYELIRDLERGLPLEIGERDELMQGLRGEATPDYMHLYPHLIGEYLKERGES